MYFLENKEKIITFISIRLKIEELIKVYFFNFVSDKAKIWKAEIILRQQN